MEDMPTVGAQIANLLRSMAGSSTLLSSSWLSSGVSHVLVATQYYASSSLVSVSMEGAVQGTKRV